MGERVSNDTAEGVTPATAQAQELLVQANLESVGLPTTEGAHGFIRNLSGIRDRWGVARNRAALFYCPENLISQEKYDA